MLTLPLISSKATPQVNQHLGDFDVDEGWQRLLQAVLPHLTSRRVGRLTGKSHRVAQKWFSGEMDIPLSVLNDVGKQAALLREDDFPQRLDAVISDALTTELHKEVIASHLAAQYKRVTGLEIE